MSVCGGVNANNTECLRYDVGADRWASTGAGAVDAGRVESAGMGLPDGRWWITGGGLNGLNDALVLSSTEILTADLSASPGSVQLPARLHHHNLVRLGPAGSDRYFLYAGLPPEESGRAWIYDFADPAVGWVEQEPSGVPRGAACAGYVLGRDGEDWVSAVGYHLHYC